MEKIILKSATLVNTAMWETKYELYKIKGEDVAHVITRQTYYYDNITKENDEVFENFEKAYHRFHYLLQNWL